MLAMACLTLPGIAQEAAPAGKLRLHAIFDSDMVLQRGKPITIWGWAAPGATVSVQLGKDKAEAKAAADKGRWEVTFPAREASAEPQTLTVTAGGEKVEMGNIVVGDVWVMYGQSNMAFPLEKVSNRDTESAQANLPNLRLFSIATNEQADPQEDIRRETIDTGGWVTSTPETALEFSAIGFVFGKQIQLSTGIPIGVIKNSRGGASMEALVPIQKFQEIPSGKALVESINAQRATFDLQAESLKTYEKELKQAKDKKLPEDKWPKKPVQWGERSLLEHSRQKPEPPRQRLQRHVRRVQRLQHQGRAAPPRLQQRDDRQLPSQILPLDDQSPDRRRA